MAIEIDEVPIEGKAWITLITNPSYIPGLLVLQRTLSSVSAYPLVVMTTPGLSNSSREIIRSFAIPVIEVPHLSPSEGRHGGFDPSFARFNDAWTKLQVFGLTQFEKLILIDSDMIFLRGMDELFEYELPGEDWIAASPACVCNPFKISHYPKDWIPSNCSLSVQNPYSTLDSPPIPPSESTRTSHLLNSGLVVFHPSQDKMDKLIHHLNTSPSIPDLKFPDQEVMADVFRGKWKPLPWWCNALKTERAVHKNIWKDEEVRLIHYILDKPWNHRPTCLAPHESTHIQLPPTPITPTSSSMTKIARRPLPDGLLEAVKSTPSQKSLTDYDDVHAWWWIAYEDLLDEWKRENKQSWREIDAYVKR
ncbi:uncharacterized protein IL334_000902 [Kwoniella shivajii]|uniref:Galactinol synthase n=1 Tax=Kwoniella shivajii TaxID=564305 RepID=A0ABZ1CQT0_9TREE|nr:hypothetical protein IL334_000902 [Kwoniella shivajii]